MVLVVISIAGLLVQKLFRLLPKKRLSPPNPVSPICLWLRFRRRQHLRQLEENHGVFSSTDLLPLSLGFLAMLVTRLRHRHLMK
ncbi:hypothetical protein SLE2022_019530 [Rubroshorea leprosula]